MTSLTETLLKELLPSKTLDILATDFHMTAFIKVFNDIEGIGNIGGWYYDMETKQIFWTKQTYKIYGLPYDETVSAGLGISFYEAEAQNQISKAFNELLEKGMPYELELPFRNNAGEARWVRTSGNVFKQSGYPKLLYGAIEDITARKVLSNSKSRDKISNESILNNVNDCIITIDSRGTILSSSKSIEKLFGYTEEEVINKPVKILMPKPHSEMHDDYMESYQRTGKAKIIGIGRELPALRKNGEIFPIELSLSEVIYDNEKAYIGIVKDISERKEAEKRLHQLAFYDSITEMLNFVSFEQDVNKTLFNIKNLGSQGSVLLIDIDKFSQLNLIYGRDIGDMLLKEMGKRIQYCISELGHCYRESKDRFYALLPNLVAGNDILSKDSDIEEKMAAIREFLSSQINVGAFQIPVSVSVVGLDLSGKNYSFQEIIELLDVGNNKLKKLGGNGTRLISEKDAEQTIIQKEILFAVESSRCIDEISVVFQPQFDNEGRIESSEVLARWHSKSLGYISPNTFIPIADQSGLISKIGNVVFHKMAEAQKKVSLLTGEIPKVSVNISSKQIAQPDFEQQLIATMDEYGIPYHKVCLEVTESVLIADLFLVSEKMKRLTSKGFEFAVDDFGTGYSSLSYLKHLPICELKIDRDFVDDIRSVHEEAPLVNAVLGMAQALKLRVVAEGIENQVQRQYLTDRKCELGQGYYLSKPLDFSEWSKLKLT